MDLELERPIVFFDIESTGLDTERDRIVELAAIKIHPDGTREERNRRFNPLMPIPKEATAVHGITDDDVKNEPPFYRVAGGKNGIAAFFRGCDLGGFNIIYFDIPLLKKELERADQTLDLSEVAVVDVMRIFKKREPRDLEAAVRFYLGRSHEDAHAALGDVLATVDVLIGQLERYDDLPKTPEGLDLEVRHKDAVDRLGKLRWHDGEIVLGFGTHKGRTLRYLAREEPSYIHWLIEKGVVEDGAHHLRDALLGRFATREETP
jgi:DNA polymerase III subunit epsilon